MVLNGTLKNPEPFGEENVAGLKALATTNHEHLCHHQSGSRSKFLSETKSICQILIKEQ
jgi:hypothetical protein